ncbi:hypothetical protein [Pimelobacter sp. 30-1]|uniref:hypothetical protein n=1 Tax=Pimelobacter sp. 30-1 TaxID=2004991 RepID=UPI001C05B2B6|nr:hypothetical protein [Pimelobacter sp. 30-1]MBU2695136.1 hypothetical protein [Pimelobacter sp. 30-1]
MNDFYVDETKARNYLVAAAAVPDRGTPAARRAVRGLLHGAQRSIHMKTESRARKRAIALTISGLRDHGVQVLLYDAGRIGTERDRRRRCLAHLVDDVADRDGRHVVFDLDDSLRSWDRQQVIDLCRPKGPSARFTYDHVHRHHEPLLALPDVVAWCWAAGGEWRTLVRPVVAEVRRID